MAFTTKQTSSGTLELYQDGQRVATGTPDYINSIVAGKTPAPVVTTAPQSVSTPAPTNASVPSPYQPQQSNLVSFADALATATDIAKKKRNELNLGIMTPYKGTLAASDFTSMLSNMNRASSSYGQDLTKNILAERELERKKVEQETTAGRDLLLKLGENKVKTDVISNISTLISSGNLDAAITLSAKALSEAKQGEKKYAYDQVGSTLYQWEVDENGKRTNRTVVVQGSSENNDETILAKDLSDAANILSTNPDIDQTALKRRFLEKHPSKATLWDEYFPF